MPVSIEFSSRLVDREGLQQCARWMAEGRLRANVGRVLPLSEAATAHRLQEENTLHAAGTLAGKIVLEPD